MAKKILALIVAFGLAQLLAVAQASETFHLSFDDGLDSPLKAKDVKLVPGVKGQGAHIGPEGVLSYPSAGKIAADKGTVSMWVKLDWSPVGSDNFTDRPVMGEPGWKKWKRSLFRASPALNPTPLSTHPYSNFMNKIKAGDWHHYAVTWDAETRKMSILRDGLPVKSMWVSKLKDKYFAQKIAKELALGSANSLQLGLDGVLDEVRIFDQVLTDSEIKSLHAEFFPIEPVVLDHAETAGNADAYFRVRFVNTTDAPQNKDYVATVFAPDGKQLLKTKFAVAAKPNETVIKTLRFVPPTPGDYQLKFNVDGLQQKTSVLVAISKKSVTASMPLSATGETRKKLLTAINCAQDLSENLYRDDGNCRVVKSPSGAYREAPNEAGSGFAYRFKIAHPGRPHWLEIDYPDDAERCFSLVVYNRIMKPYPRVYAGGCLDTVGIITGGAHPLSHQTQSKRLLFWPDTDEIMVGCWTHFPKEGGAAASALRLYENDGPLPKLELNYPKDAPRRALNVWNEDPTMLASNWFNRPECYPAADFNFWLTKLDRMVKYLRFVGRDHWSFELFDYEGDNSYTLLHMFPIASASSARVPGYCDLIATVFDREDIPFFVDVNQSLKGHSKEKGLGLLLDPASVSPDFAAAAAKGDSAVEEFTAANALSQNLNPLHPQTQAVYLKLFAAYRDKFGRYRKFQGINNTSARQIAFTGDDAGYSDYNTHLFERETGIDIPVPDNLSDRFSKRHAWLKANAWDKWITWRCEKIRDFLARLLQELNSNGVTGKQLVIRASLPTRHDRNPNTVVKAAAAGEEPPSVIELLRDRGIDVAMLSQVKGLIPEVVVKPNSEIHSRRLDSRYYYFSPDFAALAKGDQYPAVLLHQHSNLERWDSKIQNIKSFWWPLGICVYNSGKASHYSTPHPDNKYVPEHMVWALAEFDPWFLDEGFWGCPENGDYQAYQKFHQSYLSIPRLPFAKAKGTSDPATVRVHNSDQGHWLYVVNKASYPVKVSFDMSGEKFSRELKKHEVVVLQRPKDIAVSNIVQEIPETEKKRIGTILTEWERKLALCKTIHGAPPASAVKIVAAAKRYYEAGEFVRAERRMESVALRVMAKELRCGLKRSLSPDGVLSLRFFNTETSPVSGEISVDTWPRGWNLAEPSVKFKNLAPGSSFDAVFHFELPAFWHGGAQFNFVSRLTLDGETPQEKKFSIVPFLALKAERPIKIDGDAADWDKDAVWYKLKISKEHEKKYGKRLKPCSAQYAWRWDKNGLALAVKVEEADFMPPDTLGHLYRADSLQVYFDQLDNKSRAYDGNDLVYQLGLLNGKPTAWRELVPEGLPPGLTDKVQVAVKRDGNTTFYEAFFPKSEFNRTKIASGTMLGFSLMVNNLDSRGPGREIRSCLNVNPNSSPYRNPWSWRDLLLVDAPPSRLRASVEGDAPIKPATDDMERAHWLKDKPKQSAKVLLFNSNQLSSKWRKESFEFVPEADGQVKLSLAGPWVSKGARRPACWIKDVKVKGAAIRPLDKWSHRDLPEARRSGDVLEVGVDKDHPIFTKFQVKKNVPVKVELEARAAVAE